MVSATVGERVGLVASRCPLCERLDAEPLAVGADFEHPDSLVGYLALRCNGCGLVYLDRHPAGTRDDTPAYLDRTTARALLTACGPAPTDAHVLVLGAADIDLAALQVCAPPSWHVAPDVVDLEAPVTARYDAIVLVHALERSADPVALARRARDAVRPGGRVVVLAENTGSVAFTLFKGRHWAGYRFPHHWFLFDDTALRRLAATVGLDPVRIETLPGPDRWAVSIRALLADWGASPRVIARFEPETRATKALGRGIEAACHLAGRGALLLALLERPR